MVQKLLDDEFDDDDVAFNDNFDIDKLIESFARGREKAKKAQAEIKTMFELLEK